MAQSSPRLSIVMPVYNEEKSISTVLQRLVDLPLPSYEVVIVDDGSTDGTRALLQRWQGAHGGRFRVILQERNTGKGGAVRRGVQEARGEYVVIQDADLEYDPRDLARLYREIEQGRAQVVYGSRFLGHGEFLLTSRIANRLLSLLTSVLFGKKITDMETCYKMMPRDLYLSLQIRANRFDMEPEITAKLLRQGIRIREVPIRYRGRSRTEGKKIGVKDGLQAVFTLVRYRVAR